MVERDPSAGAKFTRLDPDLYAYLVEHGVRQDEVLDRLAAESAALGEVSVMQVAPEQGAFMTLLVRAIGARRALELGTFTGYSAICIARGLAEDGLLVTADVSEEWTRIARRYFDEAGVAGRIELRLEPALDVLASLKGSEPFDFAFIDADKPNYPDYWERVVELLRPGGIAVVDNVFAGGSVTEGSPGQGFSEESLEAIRSLNERIAADERVDIAMLGVADGITIALKR
jgi:caffeoyl-CoA O-methyltransferase